MKKLFVVLLLILIFFATVSCADRTDSADPTEGGADCTDSADPTDSEAAEPEVIPEERSLQEVDLSSFGDIHVTDCDTNGRYMAMLYDSFAPGVGGENCAEEPEWEVTVYLSLYDVKEEAFVKTVQVDDYARAIAFDGDYIQVWSYFWDEEKEEEELESSVLYDFDLKQCQAGEGKGFDPYDIANEIATINTYRFAIYDSFAHDSNYINYDLMVFYHDAENYYIQERKENSCIVSSSEKLVLESSLDDRDGSHRLCLRVRDYESRKTVNTVLIENHTDFDSVTVGRINETAACFVTINADAMADRLCYWSYWKDAENEDFACDVVNDADFDTKTEEIIAEISENYGVKVELNPKNAENLCDYTTLDNRCNAEYLLCLYDLAYCFSTLPAELCTEMLCKDIEAPVCSFEEYHIYLVGEIEDEATDACAYNLNDDLYIIYGCNAFYYSIFCHELMHNMEYRIWNYAPAFEEEWEALNPEGFEYSDEYWEVYYGNEAYQDYFMRDYGTRSYFEDRATIFEAILDDARDENNDPYWTECLPLMKKASLLHQTLKESFPSLSGDMRWDAYFSA